MLIPLLAKKFIKNSGNTESPEVRRAYGTLCGLTGIALNLLLFAIKLLAGLLSGSIAVTADAFNNLSDSASSIVTTLGFRLGGKKADMRHPYGHARLEYISGLVIAVMILFTAVELIKSSIAKLLSPEPVEASPLVVIILALSIAIKVYMALYNRRYGRLFSSEAMLATSDDARNDVLTTGAVLISIMLSQKAVWVDGVCGLLVGLFVLYSGLKIASDTVGAILGKPPEREYVEKIRSLVLAHEGILGVHDIIVHDYGPGNKMVSLHAEVGAAKSAMELHDLIDVIESELETKLGCQAVIHMDPVEDLDDDADSIRKLIKSVLYGIDPEISLHDLRISCNGVRKITFDILVPYACKLTDAELQSRVIQAVGMSADGCELALKVDRGGY